MPTRHPCIDGWQQTAGVHCCCRYLDHSFGFNMTQVDEQYLVGKHLTAHPWKPWRSRAGKQRRAHLRSPEAYRARLARAVSSSAPRTDRSEQRCWKVETATGGVPVRFTSNRLRKNRMKSAGEQSARLETGGSSRELRAMFNRLTYSLSSSRLMMPHAVF